LALPIILLEYNSFHSFSHWHGFKAMEERVTPFIDDKEVVIEFLKKPR
jgi:hypothetical protein